MKRTTGTTGAIALAALLLLPGCASRKGPPDPAKVRAEIIATLDGEKDLIRSEVRDPERAERLIGMLDDRDRLVAELAETVRGYSEKMSALNADYGADRASFDQLVSDYNAKRVQSQRHLAELIEAMKRETTAPEWKAIAKYQLKKLNPREMAYDRAGGGW